MRTALSSWLFTVKTFTVYSVPADSSVTVTDAASLAGVSVLESSPAPIVTLYPVNLSESGAVQVRVNPSVVLVSTTNDVGGRGTAVHKRTRFRSRTQNNHNKVHCVIDGVTESTNVTGDTV